MRVYLTTPARDFKPNYIVSLIKTLTYFPGKKVNGETVEFAFATHESSDIYIARNACLFDNHVHGNKLQPLPFNGEPYDWVFWIDSDVRWEPKDIEKLISTDKDVVSGMVPINPTNMTNVGWFQEDGLARAHGDFFRTPGLAQVDFCGFAFVAMRKGVLERIGYPWFKATFKKDPLGRVIPNSEDIGLCRRLGDAGITIWVDPTVIIPHRKSVVMGLRQAEELREDFQGVDSGGAMVVGK